MMISTPSWNEEIFPRRMADESTSTHTEFDEDRTDGKREDCNYERRTVEDLAASGGG